MKYDLTAAAGISIVGQRYERLKIIAIYSKKGCKKMVLCVCDCGVKKIIRLSHIKSKKIRSCGCLQKELTKKRFTTHGQNIKKKKTKVYECWFHIKTRCTNKSSPAYKDYGGRGIKVKWKSFEDFYADMGEPPTPKHSIDRIDNNGHYEKKNCRWATMKEQNNNRRDNHFLELDGEKLTIAMWAEKLNVPSGRLERRIKSGWSVEDVLKKPKIKYEKK